MREKGSVTRLTRLLASRVTVQRAPLGLAIDCSKANPPPAAAEP